MQRMVARRYICVRLWGGQRSYEISRSIAARWKRFANLVAINLKASIWF